MSSTPVQALAPGGALTLGLLIPCRNEAAVVERKIRNLARVRWPRSAKPHRIVIVDDGSEDGTDARASGVVERSLGAGEAGVIATVISNGVRPGKPGAIQQGILALDGLVDLVVLSDADVVLDAGSLLALEHAFAGAPTLAMASGAQRFVRDLASDGSSRSASGGALADAPAAFDRWTERVRRLESKRGCLFSVHGQLLAWRADLKLRPQTGIAADDLDLMLQVRSRDVQPREVRLVAGAVFFEIKTPPGALATAQALRRARAYLQVMRASRSAGEGAFERLQWTMYRYVPSLSPLSTALVPSAAIASAWILGDRALGIAVALFFGLVLLSPPGWRWVKLMLLISRAKALEETETLPERWEMARR